MKILVTGGAGDIAKCFADATKTIDEMCEDSWKWQSNNPSGYKVGRL